MDVNDGMRYDNIQFTLYDNLCCKYERQPFTELNILREGDHVMSFTGI